jgi:hypothetical protein
MATLITKNSSTASSIPTAAQLVQGELAVNVADKRIFTENSAGAVVELGTNPSSITTGAISATGALTTAAIKEVSGNVGIGTSSPVARADIISNSAYQLHLATTTGNYSNAGIYLGALGTSDPNYYGFLSWDQTSETTRIGAKTPSATGGIAFYTAGNAPPVERARIDSSGNLLVGTTGPVISGSESVSFGKIGAVGLIGASSTTIYSMYMQNDAGSGASSPMIRFSTSNGVSGTIISAGSSTTYATSSDYRLKHNVAPMTGALDKVALLKPCTYKWNADGSDGQGFIAHELQAVEPGCVTGKKDETETRTVETSPAIPAEFDAEGVETSPAVAAVTEEQVFPTYQGIDTSFLVATLAAAIQELKVIVDEQAVKIAALEAA